MLTFDTFRAAADHSNRTDLWTPIRIDADGTVTEADDMVTEEVVSAVDSDPSNGFDGLWIRAPYDAASVVTEMIEYPAASAALSPWVIRDLYERVAGDSDAPVVFQCAAVDYWPDEPAEDAEPESLGYVVVMALAPVN